MDREQLQSDDDVEEILRIAVRREGKTDPDLRHRLHTAASELGISDNALQAAEEEYYKKTRVDQDLAEFNSRKRRDFRGHFTTYILVILGLFGLNVFTIRDGGDLWAMYPMLGWGIGIAIHGFSAYSRSTRDDPEFLKWRRRLLTGNDDDAD
jgi:hypothetical protein